jgi:hypothetical protein
MRALENDELLADLDAGKGGHHPGKGPERGGEQGPPVVYIV